MASPQTPVSEGPADERLQDRAHGLSVALQAAGLVSWCWDLRADRWAPIADDAQALMRCFGLVGAQAVPVPARMADWLPCVHPDDAAPVIPTSAMTPNPRPCATRGRRFSSSACG